MSLAQLLEKGGLRHSATATPATVRLFLPPSVATVATVAVANLQKSPANDPALTTNTVQAVITDSGNISDPDRWCYPNSEAMTGSEIDTFAARLSRFTTKGVIQIDAEKLADKLVIRDREDDDRRLCLECTHLGGYGRTSWRCGNWEQAAISFTARDNLFAPDLILLLQRCAGFTDVINPTTKVS